MRIMLLVMLFGGAAWGADAATQPATQPLPPPVVYRMDVSANPAMRVHVVTVDLRDPRVHVVVSRGGTDARMTAPWETTLMPVSEMAQRDGLAAAVNGNFFVGKDSIAAFGHVYAYKHGNWARTCGWAMSGGVLFSAKPLNADWPSLVVNAKGKVAIRKFAALPADAREVVSGNLIFVDQGKNVVRPDQAVKPRTAAGISRDGNQLFLVVVDGSRPGVSVGMTEHAMGDEMVKAGAWTALGLDSGGSSTMVIRDGKGKAAVVNTPSDGHGLGDLSVERNVADALGVVVDQPVTRN